MPITVPTGFRDHADLNSGVIAESNAASSSSTPASQGRACTNCVRAKAKCSSTEIGIKCERCERMRKDCQPSPPVRKRRAVKRLPTTRTAQIEQKLDGLVQLLESATKPTTMAARATDGTSININSTSPNGFLSSPDNTSDMSHYIDNPALANAIGIHHSIPTPAPSLSETTSHHRHPAIRSSWELPMQDADNFLDKFRTTFVQYLPFVIISSSTTAAQLRQERPLLWLAIMAVASNQSTQQINFSRELRISFGQEVFVEARRSMDLLLAILVYVTWDRRFCIEKQIMTSLIQLAISLVYDLGLHKPPSKSQLGIPGDEKPYHSETSRTRTMEDRRALLACFLINSTTCYFQKQDSLRWTTYFAECLRVIEVTGEYDSDILLAQIVKSRLVFDKVMLAPWHNPIPDVDNVTRPPAIFYLNTLERQMQDFKSNIPVELQDNVALFLGLCHLEGSIYEIGCSPEPDVFSVQSNRRMECLYGCLNAVKGCINVFEKFTPTQLFGLPLTVYMATWQTMALFYRISVFEHPEWDLALVRAAVDFAAVLASSEEKYSRVKDEAGLDCNGSDDPDPYTLLAGRLRKMRLWYEAMIANATVLREDATVLDSIGDYSLDVDEDMFNLFGSWG